MERNQALELLKNKIKNKNMIKHCLATEACLIKLAEYFKEDVNKWGIAGLLHDYDYEEMINFPEKHALVGADELEKLGLDKESAQAIRAHNEMNGTPRNTVFEKAIYSVDPMTGLIVAAALVLPSKKISELTTESIINRVKEERFAAGAKRKNILACSEFGLTLEQFSKICLEAMQGISNELGL
ncbi:MAG TPA: HDIG domain-containing protein [Candidatus Paceibacterota bacterium]|nr:HDIG domain-containing protein [Candidatus Paceibacterota bacterium]